MNRWTMALLVAATTLTGTAAAMATPSTEPAPLSASVSARPTRGSVFQLPKAEALGAALGAVVSVNVASRMRAKGRDRKSGR